MRNLVVSVFTLLSLLSLPERSILRSGSMIEEMDGALPSTGDVTAIVDAGDDGGVDCAGARSRNVDSRRVEGTLMGCGADIVSLWFMFVVCVDYVLARQAR